MIVNVSEILAFFSKHLFAVNRKLKEAQETVIEKSHLSQLLIYSFMFLIEGSSKLLSHRIPHTQVFKLNNRR